VCGLYPGPTLIEGGREAASEREREDGPRERERERDVLSVCFDNVYETLFTRNGRLIINKYKHNI